MIYLVFPRVSNIFMHVAAMIVHSVLEIIEGLFAVGLMGSTAVLFLSLVEDVKTIRS